MRANRAMWTAALVVAGTLAGTRAQAADTVNSEAVVVRRVIVSIPDRKLAVVENNEIVQVFAVAVGAPVSPSPVGTFTIVNRVANPTYYHPGKVIGSGPQNPLGTRWIGLSQKGYGHPRYRPALVHRPREIARLHPVAQRRRRAAVRTRPRRRRRGTARRANPGNRPALRKHSLRLHRRSDRAQRGPTC